MAGRFGQVIAGHVGWGGENMKRIEVSLRDDFMKHFRILTAGVLEFSLIL